MKAGEPKPKEKAEINIIEGTKKALNVTEAEIDVTSFLDNLLKSTATTESTKEAKTNLELYFWGTKPAIPEETC